MRNKIIIAGLLGTFVLVFLGCLKKTEAPTDGIKPMPAIEKNNNQSSVSSETQEEVLPKATGKADDLINAAFQEADGEKTSLTEEEKAASDAAGDTEEINNLSNSYDEKEL